MQFFRVLIVLFSLLGGLGAVAHAGLPKEKCRVMAKSLETISNLNQREVEARASAVLDSLKGGDAPAYYFIAYNIYVENLFNRGKVDKAHSELVKMLKDAHEQSDAECKAIALRTQGQFYYKLGLYERAAECFRNAMEECPRYDSSKLESPFTWSSILFWLVQSDIRVGKTAEAERLLGEMEGMMRWLDAHGETDPVGYKQVMILGLKAKIALNKGDLSRARTLLDSCRVYIRPDVPERAYVEYHIGNMSLAVKEGRHADAIPMLDRLIEMHIDDYKPIAAEFIDRKAASLYELGRYQESATTLRRYLDLKRETDAVAIAQQLDDLKTRYKVEEMHRKQEMMRNNLIFAIILCVGLVGATVLLVMSRRRLKRKNKVLANTLSSLHRLSREPRQQSGRAQCRNDEVRSLTETALPIPDLGDKSAPSPGLPTPNPELEAVGAKIVDYIKSSKCYLKADCGRDTVKEGIGVSEQMLSKAMPVATGMTFVNYINSLRVSHAIELLDNHPEMSINDISSACGFGSLRQFQRIFKQHCDLSPSAYRVSRNG